METRFSNSDAIDIAIVVAGFHKVRVQSFANTYLKNKVSFISAYGENTQPDNWYNNEVGRRIIYDELQKLSWAR
jgi:hypothetical protein